MALPRLMADMTGNVDMADATRITFDSSTNLPIPGATQPYIIAGSVDPSGVLLAPKGTLFINLSGSGVANRMFINTTGSTVWTGVSTVA